jgi:hypothetical protein
MGADGDNDGRLVTVTIGGSDNNRTSVKVSGGAKSSRPEKNKTPVKVAMVPTTNAVDDAVEAQRMKRRHEKNVLRHQRQKLKKKMFKMLAAQSKGSVPSGGEGTDPLGGIEGFYDSACGVGNDGSGSGGGGGNYSQGNYEDHRHVEEGEEEETSDWSLATQFQSHLAIC